MLSVLAVAFAAQLPDQNLQAWQATLRKVAGAERASLCVDVDLTTKPAPLVYQNPEGVRGLDRLAVATKRSYSVVDGVYVFRRKLEVDDLRLETPHQHAIDFLTSLGVVDISKLRDGKLDFSSLSSVMQRKLRFAIASLGNGLGDSMIGEYPNRIGMRLMFEPVATANSRTGDGVVRVELTPEKPDVPLPDGGRRVTEEPLGRPEIGQIDFEDGAVFTLRELVDRMQKSFGTTYWYDNRLEYSSIFVSGRFTEERLRRVLDSVTEPAVITPVPDSFRTESYDRERMQIINLAYGPMGNDRIGLSDLTFNHLIVGRSTNFKELFGTRPPRNIQRFMSDYRIQPDDEVNVFGELYLAIAAPGLATMYSDARDALGNPVPYSLPHYIKLSF